MAGNFRFAVTGADLNRKWQNPSPTLHPQIYYLKNYLKKLITEENREILVFCDLHGHGKKCNSFIYGCDKAIKGGFCNWTKVRLLPRIMAKNTPLFSYKDCAFHIEKSKASTARVIIWKEFHVTNSFTLESSAYGYQRGEEIKQYEEWDYYKIGSCLMVSLLEYMRLLKQLEFELAITKGWLKPSQLAQLTGTPAADIINKAIAIEKEELSKKRRSEKVAQCIEAKRSAAKSHNMKHVKKAIYTESDSTGKLVRNKITAESITKIYSSQTSKKDSFFPSIHLKQIKETNPSDTSRNALQHKITEEPSYQESNGEESNLQNANWKQYFSEEELNTAINQINSGIDPNDLEHTISDDSNSFSDEDSQGREQDKNPPNTKTNQASEGGINKMAGHRNISESKIRFPRKQEGVEIISEISPPDLNKKSTQSTSNMGYRPLPFSIDKARSLTNRKNSNILSKVVMALAKSHRSDYKIKHGWVINKSAEDYSYPELQLKKAESETKKDPKLNLFIEGINKVNCKPFQKRVSSNGQLYLPPAEFGDHSSPKASYKFFMNPYEHCVKPITQGPYYHTHDHVISKPCIEAMKISQKHDIMDMVKEEKKSSYKKLISMKGFVYNSKKKINRMDNDIVIKKAVLEILNNSYSGKYKAHN